ncbi:hypothetical protein [Nostoc sp.]|uniref:hypothetical protein n=1 Tax=Nostoc sp. TaxID=1180 RepID=UPI002FF67CAF
MTATLTRTWSVEFEKETLEKLFSKYAPHVPLTRKHPSRPPITEAEKENFYQYWAATGGHDLSIVHRVTISNWWRKKFEQASPNERVEVAAQLLELDEEIQQRRAAYIKQRWHDIVKQIQSFRNSPQFCNRKY